MAYTGGSEQLFSLIWNVMLVMPWGHVVLKHPYVLMHSYWFRVSFKILSILIQWFLLTSYGVYRLPSAYFSHKALWSDTLINTHKHINRWTFASVLTVRSMHNCRLWAVFDMSFVKKKLLFCVNPVYLFHPGPLAISRVLLFSSG